MQSLPRYFLPHLPKPFFPTFSTTTISSPPPPNSTTTLSSSELLSLHHLLPALISTGHHLTAIHLLSTALLTSPPLPSLLLSQFSSLLSSLPSISPSITLLTSLRFHPLRPSPLPFCALLIPSYFRLNRPRDAAKIFAFLCRADSGFRPDEEIYGMAVRGFCEKGRGREAVRVVREMVRDGLVPTEEIRVLVCLVLLRGARVREGLDFEDAVRKGREGGGIVGIGEVLDRIVGEWEE